MKPYIFSFPGRRLLCAVLLGTITLLGSCKKDPEPVTPGTPTPETPAPGNDPLKPTASVTTTVAGRVTDEDGKPLSNVRVTVHGKQTVTSADGLFTLENISVPGNRCVITCKKDDYFEGIRAQIPTSGQVTRTQIVLMRSATTHTFQAASGSTATLDNGSAVQIPATSLVTASGGAYSGQVNMVVRYQDPSAPDFSTTVAGGDMLAQRTDQSTSILYSYGILRVKMTGSNGEALQMAPGKTASLTIAIPAAQLATAPATIPLWFFDEATGVWIEEGSAAKQGNQYVGTVKHFTDWNADDPKDRATIIGRLADCDGQGTIFAPIEIGQKTTWSEKRDGAFSETVPTGVTIHVTVKPFMAAHPGKQIIVVPPLSPGQVYDVGVIKSPPEFCTGEVKGSVKTTNGDHVSSITFSNAHGVLDLYQPGTNFSVQLPANSSINMKIYTAKGAVFTKTFQ
ncbi:MAG: CS1-pili formation C-terminal domain-containing protein, partial [Cytophagales bacterium]|nr:CS1-pili formation C-terminal domain-containing protein [Cytophagales bacterium]